MSIVADYFALPGRPVPEMLPEWRGFFDGCKNGELLVEACIACDNRQFYPRGQCMLCGGATRWLKCGGRGRVYTSTTVRMTRDPVFRGIAPYSIGLVEVEEGVRFHSGLIGPPEAFRIGAPVKVVFGDLAGSGVWAPSWIPDEDAG